MKRYNTMRISPYDHTRIVQNRLTVNSTITLLSTLLSLTLLSTLLSLYCHTTICLLVYVAFFCSGSRLLLFLLPRLSNTAIYRCDEAEAARALCKAKVVKAKAKKRAEDVGAWSGACPRRRRMMGSHPQRRAQRRLHPRIHLPRSHFAAKPPRRRSHLTATEPQKNPTVFSKGDSELLVAYPRPSIRLAPPAECQRFISNWLESWFFSSPRFFPPFQLCTNLSTTWSRTC
jgi:hypothetical protein